MTDETETGPETEVEPGALAYANLDANAPMRLVTTRTTEEESEAVDHFPFTLGRDTDDTPQGQPSDPTVFMARRPKTATILALQTATGAIDDIENMTQAELDSALGVMDDFIDAILDTRSRTYVRAKMKDPDSDWDLDMLLPLLEVCRGRWWPTRPTGRSGDSSGPPANTGPRSTVR